jgi:murein DD-endopeptidase MepM/ murein hydrolase activator NlpD
VSIVARFGAARSRFESLFRDHEIFVRTGGSVRFLRVSAAWQRRVAAIVGVVALAWVAVTVAMVAWQAHSAWQESDVADRQLAVERAEARVAATRASVDSVARDLDRRQDFLEAQSDLLGSQSGTDTPAANTPATGGPAAATPAERDTLSRLRAIGARQERFALAMTRAAAVRITRAEAALRKVGIAARSADRGAQGGPLIPDHRLTGVATPRAAAWRTLGATMQRMSTLEALVLALPAIRPAEVIRLSSGFGYRRDPFTGAGAMHAGLDFTGAQGSAIHAAAAGRVVSAGRMAGYGNVIEIDHGHGILTRYAHLSRFDVTLGQRVSAGQNIAGMGSTGRSTGTHLHFEVRLNGTAVNPRRFLEATSDVLEIQADVGGRSHPRITAR